MPTNEEHHPVLPDKLSDLIRVALADLRKVEAMPETYSVDMTAWHVPPNYWYKTCRVCLAGAVISQTLCEPATGVSSPGCFPLDVADKLHALDLVRTGQIGAARTMLAHENSDYNPYLYEQVPLYGKGAEEFHRCLGDIADRLEAEGF